MRRAVVGGYGWKRALAPTAAWGVRQPVLVFPGDPRRSSAADEPRHRATVILVGGTAFPAVERERMRCIHMTDPERQLIDLFGKSSWNGADVDAAQRDATRARVSPDLPHRSRWVPHGPAFFNDSQVCNTGFYAGGPDQPPVIEFEPNGGARSGSLDVESGRRARPAEQGQRKGRSDPAKQYRSTAD